MNSFQLKCFLSVAETLNFAKSARDLNTTQPTITHQIKSLEDELGIKLFNRSTRVVELTADGVAFIDDARSIVSIEDRAKLRFSIPNEESIDSITIGCVNDSQINLLAGVLSRFNSLTNHLHPRFIINTRGHLLHLLDSDQIDIVFDLVDEKEVGEKYKFVGLTDSKFVGFCKNEKPFDKIDSLSTRGRLDAPIIFTTPANNMANFSRFQILLSENLEITNIHFAPSAESAIVLAKSGIGIAVLPSIYLKNQDQMMKQIPIEESPVFKFGMFFKTPIENPILKSFINTVKAEFLN